MSAPLPRQGVLLSLPAAALARPVSANEAVILHAVKDRIERPMSKSEEPVALCFDIERDLIAVLRARLQCRECQENVHLSGEALNVKVAFCHVASLLANVDTLYIDTLYIYT